MKNVSDKSFRENQNTHFMFRNFLEDHAVCEIMWKNTVQQGRPQMTIWRTTTNTQLRICNTYFFSTATVVARTPLNVKLYVHCLSGLPAGLRRFV
jgi:hypothetical protein